MNIHLKRLRRIVAVALVLGVLLVGLAMFRAPSEVAAQAPGGIGLAAEVYAEGFNQVTDIASANDARLFVTQRTGEIRVIDANGEPLPTPFLALSPEDVCTGPYQAGLLGLAFHPDYSENGYFFIHYTTPRDGVSCEAIDNIIARYKVSDSDPNVAEPGSEEIVMRIPHILDDNFGGDLDFGPFDRYLYIPIGDGGGPRDPEGPTQDMMSPLGKILRIDVSTEETGDLYTVPSSNPYTGTTGYLPEIWAAGLRNPWRVSFDSATGDLYISDVGAGLREEINFQPGDSAGGENYGWPCYEGDVMFTDTTCSGVLTTPIFTGTHEENAFVAITGGYVYRGTEFPLLRGYYVFSDAGTGLGYTLKRDDQGVWQVTHEGLFPTAPSGIATFGEGWDGELYFADYTFDSDTVYHLGDTRPQPTLNYLPFIFRDSAPES